MIDGKSYDLIQICKEAKIDGGIDLEIKELVELINQVDGIETTESCFGHHNEPCRIYFRAKDVESILKFKRQFFYGDNIWSIELILTDTAIDNAIETGIWEDKLEFVLVSKYKDFPTVDLMIENLINRFKINLKNIL